MGMGWFKKNSKEKSYNKGPLPCGPPFQPGYTCFGHMDFTVRVFSYAGRREISPVSDFKPAKTAKIIIGAPKIVAPTLVYLSTI